jgi:hypothetical protein
VPDSIANSDFGGCGTGKQAARNCSETDFHLIGVMAAESGTAEVDL